MKATRKNKRPDGLRFVSKDVIDAASNRGSYSPVRKYLVLLVVAFLASQPLWAKDAVLLNVSYDPTRELYQQFDKAFEKYWKSTTGDSVVINQSHGASGKQARAVIDGLQADVVTLALAADIDAIVSKSRLLPNDWQKHLPENSCPYVSTIVFLVRKGNPKGIRDWDDLVRPGVSVITPNPKSSGGARWNYLAAYGYALKKNNGSEDKAKAFVAALFKNVPVLENGARSATIAFTQRGIGDVLIAWENEAILAAGETDAERVQIVVPSVTILTEPPVALVEKVARRHGNEAIAKAYLEYLYTPEGQEIAAQNYYRPRSEFVMRRYASKFPEVKTFTIGEMFGGWQAAQKAHFADGGTFDQIYQSNN
jgi:sulfate/thiosulfate-binding protein